MEIYSIVSAIRTGEKVGAIGIDKRQAGLLAIIARLYSLKGMGASAVVKGKDGKDYPTPDLQLAVTEMEKEIALKYPFLTMEEVRYALESGVKGELDDQPTYLNVANYCRWLREYRNSAARLEATQAIANGLASSQPVAQLDAGTIAARNEVACKRAYAEMLSEVKATGRISDSHVDGNCAGIYDWLRANGRMERPDAKTGQAAMDQAAKSVQAMRRVRGKEATISEIVEGAVSQVKFRAKRILLESYLRTV